MLRVGAAQENCKHHQWARQMAESLLSPHSRAGTQAHMGVYGFPTQIMGAVAIFRT